MVEKVRVCVIGGGGYQASWLVKLLLSKDYIVHATVREPGNEKNAHLKKLQNASENLKLFRAELLDHDSLLAAIEGCRGVFHVASPIQPDTAHNPEVEIFEPIVTGTYNVLKACSIAKAKRVVVVSSIGAVIYDPKCPKGQAMDESCWSDEQTCKTLEGEGGYKYNWYYLAKTAAEHKALEYGKENDLDVVTVCPSIILGPMLQSTLNTSSLVLYLMLKEGLAAVENKVRMIVDVRDVAEALLLVYEKPEAEGRYVCTSHKITVGNLVDKLKKMYPTYNHPKEIVEVDDNWDLSSMKLQKLGWRYRTLEETIVDSVKAYQEKGMLE